MKKLLKNIVGVITPTKNKNKSTIFHGPNKPKNMKKGDIWVNTSNGEFVIKL